MKKMIAMVLFLGLLGASSVSASEAVAEGATPEPSKWSKAGHEIGEAAGAVGEATTDTSKKVWETTRDGSAEAWDKTKEGTKEVWDKTKGKSKELWEKSKAKLHEATAPDTPKATTE